MADTVSTFMKRVISGLLGIGLLFAISIYGGTRGLLLICTFAVVMGIREFSRMAFNHWKMPEVLRFGYWMICLICYATMFLLAENSDVWFATAVASFIVAAIWLTRGKVTNENLLAALAMGIFGLIYCVLFPYYAVRIVQLNEGEHWFLFLLLVVFFGDTFAYFFGRWFGRRKFMPMISPNKTWEGSMGGMFGSALAGTIHLSLFFPDVAVWKTVLFCLVCGAAAQTGDLVMSLVKRVAQVKDTGSIMPGHGGILDRLDGVYIASPLVYAFALYVRPLV